MPKIHIKGETQPIVVSKENADRILEQKNDLKYKGMIDIEGRQIAKGNIKEISYSDERFSGKLNIDNQTDREKVKEFEKWLEDLKSHYEPINPIEFYGHPFKDQEKYKGIVLNEILGAAHWTLVRWALDNGAISRREGPCVSWAIVSNGSGDRIDTAIYDDLKKKMNALSDLRSRRQYAEKKELESQGQMVDAARERFVEKTTLPNDELPF